jgi:hypothetical protein
MTKAHFDFCALVLGACFGFGASDLVLARLSVLLSQQAPSIR